MTLEAVDIYVRTPWPAAAPVEGVAVKVMNMQETAVVTTAVTGADGWAHVLLPTDDYTVRFFKFGHAIKQPRILDVQENVANKFYFEAVHRVAEHPSDPRFCLVSGYFRQLNGLPHKYLNMHFNPKFDPLVLEGSGMIASKISVRSDESGHISVALLRCGQYEVLVEGTEDIYRTVSVPDAPAVNLPDLLMPVVRKVVFDVAQPVTLRVGEQLEIPLHVFTTDLNELESLGSAISWSISDPQVACFSPSRRSIILRATAAGVTELHGQRNSRSTVQIPNPPIEGLPLSITVLP